MLKTLILGFAPWIIYLFMPTSTLNEFKIAIILSLIACVVCQFRELKKGFVLSWGSLLFFLLMTVGVVVLTNSWIIKNAGIISNSALIIITFISIIIGKPFTIQYAKETVPSERWKHPLFIRINYLLSIFWLVVFMIGLLLYLIRDYFQISHWIYAFISYIPLIIGIFFTAWFPDWYKERYLRIHPLGK